MTKVRNLDYRNGRVVLLRYPTGEPALWIEDEYYSHGADKPGQRYSINDWSSSVMLDKNEDVDEIEARWKQHMGWQ